MMNFTLIRQYGPIFVLSPIFIREEKKALSTGKETAEAGENVKVTFTNEIQYLQKLTLEKKTVKADGSEYDCKESFDFTITFSNLKPGQSFASTVGKVKADEDGNAEKTISLKNGEKAEFYKIPYGMQIDEEITDVAVNDLVKNIVKQYELEVDAGIALIREYKGMKKYIMSSIKENYASPMLTLKVGDHDCSENAYIYSVRRKYWNALFRNEEFMKNMTNDQQESYLSQVDTLIHYDFSFCNIKEIQIQMAQTMVKGIEECIIKMFDECSNAHSWYPECSKNIHYYNGWCTNKAWIVNQKVILPISIFYKDYSNTTKISTSSYYNTCNVNLLHDLEKVFNYLGGTPQTAWDSFDIMRYVEKSEQIKNVRFRYFTVNFFKKGTAHITFTDENLDTLKKFNIFGSQQKGWLPPSYGKKQYHDMTPEEKSVINEFQGEDDYRYTLEHADQFIYDPKSSVPLLTQLS